MIDAIRRIWVQQPVRSFATYIALAVTVASICILLASTVLFQNLELLTLDMLFRLRGSRVSASSSNIVIVEVTPSDLQKVGRWPWPRTWLAGMVTSLKQLGAKEVLLDFLISEPSVPADDDALANAIKEAGNVYLPYGYTTGDFDFNKAFLPLEKIRPHLKGMGAVNVFADHDGKVRRIPLFHFQDYQLYKNIVLQISQDHLAMQIKSISSTQLVLANETSKVAIPLVAGNALLINWQGKWKETFQHYSFLDVLDGAKAMAQGMKPTVDLSGIKNSLCIVAVTALGLYDTRPNALEAQYYGSGFLATALVNILDQDFLKVVPTWGNILLIYLFALIPPFYVFGEKSSREIFMILFVLAALVVMYFLFMNNIVMNFSLPFIALGGSYVIVSAYHSARINTEKKNLLALATIDDLTSLFNVRYFKEILKNACWEAQRDPNQAFYLILSDIDFFKQLNDRYGHQAGDYIIAQVAKTLKTLVRVGDVTARYGGDEMILLLRATASSNAQAVAEKIRANIESLELRWDNQRLPVTVSLGMACFDPKQDNEMTIVKRADDALFLAKKQGKNQVVTL